MKQIIFKSIIGCILLLLYYNCKSFEDYIKYTDKNLKEINIDYSNVDTTNDAEIKKQLEELNILYYKKYTININDVYNIYIDSESNFNTAETLVKSDGCITIRRLGEIKVAGLTMEEANDEIKKKLSIYIKSPAIVSIIPVSLKKVKINILGEVRNPGSYSLEGNMRLIDAISAAGGITDISYYDEKVPTADLEKAYIIRKDRILPINFIELIEHGNPLHNILLQDGDYIYIPSMINNQVYILGEANKPGKYMKTRHLTLCKLLAHAGGLKPTASQFIFIIRSKKNLLKSVIYCVNIKDILRDGMPDLILQRDDIIYIPKFTLLNEDVPKFSID